ncbi:MAG: Trm112 family protein [Candidatus Verstraetearchaeota archaeon]|nr:Trm112 family protein [Candidatus Verstraetearchaeota archaeon]RLE56494.1 MAG: Trm112 family protein [Candidatus Verstraetearchaeota archaeon]
MKYRLMDILACPICKHFPLELYVFDEKKYSYNIKLEKKVLCEEYCGLNYKFIRDLDPAKLNCKACLEREVNEGLLVCPQCNRWYPIIEEIPHMLPDELRDKDEDLAFLRKYREKIPRKVLLEGKPWNLSESN